MTKGGSNVITILHGNLLEAVADLYINPVNTVGVMGAGVAKAFKLKYPDMYQDYRKACSKGQVYVKVEGNKIKYKPHVWIHPKRQFLIINLPTKTHWKYPSRYEYIVAGLLWIRNNFDKLQRALGRPIKTIAMPFVGCGLGGLSKHKVLRLIANYLYDLCDINIYTL